MHKLESVQERQPAIPAEQDRQLLPDKYVPKGQIHTLPDKTNGLEHVVQTVVDEQFEQPTRVIVQATQLVIAVLGSRAVPGLQRQSPPERLKSLDVSQAAQLVREVQSWQPVAQLAQVDPLRYLPG